jgi:hypothetical protein
MPSRERLRERLGDLARARRVGAAGAEARVPDALAPAEDAAPIVPPSPPSRAARQRARLERERAGDAERAGVEEFLPGGEWRGERGTVYVHERLRSTVERPRAHWGRLGEPPADEPELLGLATLGLSQALFLDLETGGLASSPVFLAGTMHWNGEDFVLRQYFARHYGEEAALLEALREAVRGFAYLVTFNGRSYDAPFLLGRAAVHAVPLALPPRHLDLLHVSRRRWKGELADCRLQTLERHLTRRRRSGDVPGEEVPGLYHDYVRSGDPYRMVPVFHHNLLDVITMGEILHALCAPAGAHRVGARGAVRKAAGKAAGRADRPLTWP